MSERYTWTNIDSTRVDPDQFFTAELGLEMLDNIKNLADAMWAYDGQARRYGGGPHPHTHDSTNSAFVVAMGMDLIDSTSLKDNCVVYGKLDSTCVDNAQMRDGAITVTQMLYNAGETYKEDSECLLVHYRSMGSDGSWRQCSHFANECP